MTPSFIFIQFITTEAGLIENIFILKSIYIIITILYINDGIEKDVHADIKIVLFT